MSQTLKTLSIEVSEDLDAQISAIAAQTGRSQSVVISDALDAYVDDQLSWLQNMECAMKEVEDGQTFNGDQVLQWIDNWDTASPIDRPDLAK